MIYYHKHEVRWSDIDANRHLANSSYVQYCANENGFYDKTQNGRCSTQQMGNWPCDFARKIFVFFKEVYADQEVIVSLEISGSSEDASIYQFTHKFYLPDGHCATAEATGVWIDMMLRKTTTPPDDILVVMNDFKTENTKLFSREDIKALPFRPENIDASLMDLNR